MDGKVKKESATWFSLFAVALAICVELSPWSLRMWLPQRTTHSTHKRHFPISSEKLQEQRVSETETKPVVCIVPFLKRGYSIHLPPTQRVQ